MPQLRITTQQAAEAAHINSLCRTPEHSPFQAAVQQARCMCPKVPHQLLTALLLQRRPGLVLCEVVQLVPHDLSTPDVGDHDLQAGQQETDTRTQSCWKFINACALHTTHTLS